MKNYCLILFVLFSLFVQAQEKSGQLKQKIELEFEMNYLLRLPENQSNKYPLLVFLHGAGERGNDLSKVKLNGPLKEEYKEYTKDLAILAPQCPEGRYWDIETVYQVIQKVIKDNPKIDTSRIYLSGLSMGGWGSWRLAEKYPSTFAALVTVCGPAGLPELRESHFLKNIPIRIFHGALDDIVPVGNSIMMYQELKKIGANVDLTIFKDDNHNSWDSTFSNPEMYQWLKEQKLKK